MPVKEMQNLCKIKQECRQTAWYLTDLNVWVISRTSCHKVHPPVVSRTNPCPGDSHSSYSCQGLQSCFQEVCINCCWNTWNHHKNNKWKSFSWLWCKYMPLIYVISNGVFPKSMFKCLVSVTKCIVSSHCVICDKLLLGTIDNICLCLYPPLSTWPLERMSNVPETGGEAVCVRLTAIWAPAGQPASL